MPTYKIASWNKLAGTIHYRTEGHDKYEKAVSSTVAPNIVANYGTGEYKVQEMLANYVTVAFEDEMQFKTGAGNVAVTAGVSYDAQKIDKLKMRSNAKDDTLNQMITGYYAKKDTLLWGTRDSINPVASVVYDPIRDFLRLRAAGSMKTKFPSLSIYKDMTSTTDLTIEPERIYSANAGAELFFLNNALSLRSDYFYTRINNKIVSLYSAADTLTAYRNISGYVVQGVETSVQGSLEHVIPYTDISGSLGYVYSYARNYDTSTATMGKLVENIPVHQVIAQIAFDFVSKTKFMAWGTYTNNQIKYVMAYIPASTDAYTTAAYKTVKLHDSLILNLKLSQKIFENFEVYVTCKNVLDDYDADPLNPGPGRSFYIGGGAQF